MAGNSAAPGRTVTSKVLAILDAFAGGSPERSLADLRRATGLSSTTVHRLVQELLEGGLLERAGAGHYAVGIRLWEISVRAPRPAGLLEVATPFLRDLQAATGEIVQLAVPDAGQALLVESIAGRATIPGIGAVGARGPLHAGAAGRALLAHCARDVQSQVLAELTGDLADLRVMLAHVRRTGLAFRYGDPVDGALCCAAPVRGSGSGSVAAVAVVAPAGSRIGVLGPAVLAAAYGIGAALAGRSGAPGPGAAGPGPGVDAGVRAAQRPAPMTSAGSPTAADRASG